MGGVDVSEFQFDFSFIKNGTPIVTLNSIGMAFNSGCRAMLGFPAQINIGYDERANALAFRPHDPNSDAIPYDFETREKDGWIRLSMRDFMRFLYQRSGIDFMHKAVQFIPDYDASSGMLTFVVDEAHIKGRARN